MPKKSTEFIAALLGCCLLALGFILIGTAVDAFLAWLITKAFPQVPFLQAFVVLFVVSTLLSGLRNATSK